MLTAIKRITIPYYFREWYLDFTTAITQIIGGLLLAFYYSPQNMGVPWQSKFNALPSFEVSSQFVETVSNFGTIFSKFPDFFACVACYSMFFGGILFILGCFVRFISLMIFLVMLNTLLFREFDHSWSYIPTFAFLSLSILGLWFGSGKFGLDYLISKKLDWV